MGRRTVRSRLPHSTSAVVGALFLAIAIGTATLSGCGSAEPRVESVVVITLDTTRADAVNLDGRTPTHTPCLASLAAEGITFERAYTTVPLTLPAHASMFTGLVPPRHRVRENGMNPLSDEAQTLAELLSSAGYRTAAFVSAEVLDSFFGLAQGFEVYDQPSADNAPSESGYVERRAGAVVDAAVRWLRDRRADERFFVWVHLFDPHVPYVAQPEFVRAAGGDAYLGEVAAADAAIGALLGELDALGRAERTLVIVVGDHGESRGEHDEPTHGALCYEATLRVPLIARHPARKQAGESTAAIVSVTDIYPTVLNALGLPVPPNLDGRDLFEPAPDPQRGVYFESMAGFVHYGWSALAGWRDESGKYLHSSVPEYYDVDDDAREVRDLVRERPDDVARARANLERILERPALSLASDHGSAEFAERLRELGYAYAPRENDDWPSPLAPSTQPSPKDRSGELQTLLNAHALQTSGRSDEARSLLLEILDGNPAHLLALDMLGKGLLEEGRYADALPVLRDRATRRSVPLDTLLNLALALEQTGDADGALSVIERAARLVPNDLDVRRILDRLREGIDREEKSEKGGTRRGSKSAQQT